MRRGFWGSAHEESYLPERCLDTWTVRGDACWRPARAKGEDMTSVQSDVREAKQFIGGEWTQASEGATFEDRDPFTGDVVASVPAGTREDARRAIEAAAAAFPEWSQSLPAQRQGIFLKAGDELVENPAVRRINFTGSTETGRRLAEAAGRNLKRVVLELGGYNPLVVLADADLDYAVNASAFGAFLHQGQICMSARKIIVERPIADEFTSRLAEKTKTLKTGDPKEPSTIIGPLINESALQLVRERVQDAVAKGAKVLAGGEADGPCFQATLITDVPESSDF